MIAGLKKVDTVDLDKIDEAVFLGDAPGPDARGEILQGFRFAYSSGKVAHNSADQVENAEGGFAIGLDPKP